MKNYCARCGKENKGQYKHRSKYCSLKCAYNTEKKKCLNCEKIFDGRNRDKYCSKNCLKEFNFKNPREIITKSLRQGSNKLNLDTYKHPVFGWVRNIYDEKICGSCKLKKKFKFFRKLKKESKAFIGGNGWCGRDLNLYISFCKECENSNFMKRYRKNPYHQLFHNFKKRSSLAKVPFQLTKDDLKDLLENSSDRCPVFGFKYIKNTDKNHRDYAPSLDRINPKKGYTKENVIVVSMLANRIKTDATIDQIGKVYQFYKNIIKKKS